MKKKQGHISPYNKSALIRPLVAVALVACVLMGTPSHATLSGTHQSAVSDSLEHQDTLKKTVVAPADLPVEIIITLGSDEYVGWVIDTAYFAEPEEEDAYYEITLLKEDEEEPKVVKLDENGKLL